LWTSSAFLIYSEKPLIKFERPVGVSKHVENTAEKYFVDSMVKKAMNANRNKSYWFVAHHK